MLKYFKNIKIKYCCPKLVRKGLVHNVLVEIKPLPTIITNGVRRLLNVINEVTKRKAPSNYSEAISCSLKLVPPLLSENLLPTRRTDQIASLAGLYSADGVISRNRLAISVYYKGIKGLAVFTPLKYLEQTGLLKLRVNNSYKQYFTINADTSKILTKLVTHPQRMAHLNSLKAKYRLQSKNLR